MDPEMDLDRHQIVTKSFSVLFPTLLKISTAINNK